MSYLQELDLQIEFQKREEARVEREIWNLHYRPYLEEMYVLFQRFWEPRPTPLSWTEFQHYVYQNTLKVWDPREHKRLRPLV